MSDELVYRPHDYRREYIQTLPELRAAVHRFAESDALGVDVEIGQRMIRKPGGVQEWKHSLALVQIASQHDSVIVDPLRCPDLSPLQPLLGGPARKVFLGGGQDVALLEGAGIPAYNVADVGEVAYAVFGRREDGMAALSKRILGLSLDKTMRRTDWLVRPLNPSLITYAFQDAELTLLIYRWFQQHYPQELAMHERRELEPAVPSSLPDWLRDALLRGSSDATIIAGEHNLDLARDAARMSAAVANALQMFSNAPRRINRLVRVSGDLGLRDLIPQIVALVDSPSSLLRAASARAVGKLMEPQEGEPILARLREDPIEDVRKAAEAATRDLKGVKRAKEGEEPAPAEEAESSSLGEDTLAALQRLMQQLDSETP